MRDSRVARDAFVRAEATTALSHQIRAIRFQRGWSQKQLAEKIGTKQTVVSRLENPAYGRVSLNTLFDLCQAFDVGLEVRFVSLLAMLEKTARAPKHEEMLVSTFDDESVLVSYYSNNSYKDAASANLENPPPKIIPVMNDLYLDHPQLK